MPAYDVNWEAYDKHKAQGGTFQNFKDKTPAELTSDVIERHMTGKETVGIYPLLKNNTSWFLAADFDGKNWMDESRRFLELVFSMKSPLIWSGPGQGMVAMSGSFLKSRIRPGKAERLRFTCCVKQRSCLSLKRMAVLIGYFLIRMIIPGKGLVT